MVNVHVIGVWSDMYGSIELFLVYLEVLLKLVDIFLVLFVVQIIE